MLVSIAEKSTRKGQIEVFEESSADDCVLKGRGSEKLVALPTGHGYEVSFL